MSIIDCSSLDLPNLRSVRSQTELCDSRTNGSWRGNSFAPSGNDPWQKKWFGWDFDFVQVANNHHDDDNLSMLMEFFLTVISFSSASRVVWSSLWRCSDSSSWNNSSAIISETPGATSPAFVYTILITAGSNGVKKRSLLVLYPWVGQLYLGLT